MSNKLLRSVKIKPTAQQRKLLHEAIEARGLAYLWALDTFSDKPYHEITQKAVSGGLTAFKKTKHGAYVRNCPDISLRKVIYDARSRLVRIVRDGEDVPLDMTEGESNRLGMGNKVHINTSGFRCFIPKIKWVLMAEKLPPGPLDTAIVQHVPMSDEWLLLFREEAPAINNTEKTAIHEFLDSCEGTPVSPRPGTLGSAWQWVRSLWVRL